MNREVLSFIEMFSCDGKSSFSINDEIYDKSSCNNNININYKLNNNQNIKDSSADLHSNQNDAKFKPKQIFVFNDIKYNHIPQEHSEIHSKNIIDDARTITDYHDSNPNSPILSAGSIRTNTMVEEKIMVNYILKLIL